MGSGYTPPEPEYATLRDYVKLRGLELAHRELASLGKRALAYHTTMGIPTTKRRGSPLNPGKMVTGYRVDVLDKIMNG